MFLTDCWVVEILEWVYKRSPRQKFYPTCSPDDKQEIGSSMTCHLWTASHVIIVFFSFHFSKFMLSFQLHSSPCLDLLPRQQHSTIYPFHSLYNRADLLTLQVVGGGQFTQQIVCVFNGFLSWLSMALPPEIVQKRHLELTILDVIADVWNPVVHHVGIVSLQWQQSLNY